MGRVLLNPEELHEKGDVGLIPPPLLTSIRTDPRGKKRTKAKFCPQLKGPEQQHVQWH